MAVMPTASVSSILAKPFRENQFLERVRLVFPLEPKLAAAP
jgi:hypothetical protein